MPPALFDRKPSGVISSPCSLPFCAIDGEAGADLDALDRVDRHHRAGDVGVELAVDRLAPAQRHACGDDVDARAARIAGLAQLIHEASSSARPAGVGRRRTGCSPTASHDLNGDRDRPDLRQVAADHARRIARAATSSRSRRRRRASRSRAPTRARRRAGRGCRTSASRCSRRGRAGTVGDLRVVLAALVLVADQQPIGVPVVRPS